VTILRSLQDLRAPAVLIAFAIAALLVGSIVPDTADALADVAVLAALGLSFDVVMRRMGTIALFHPGVMALGAWAVARLLAANQSPVIALAAAVGLGAAIATAPLLLAGSRSRHGLVLGGLAVTVAATTLLPPMRGFAPPVFLGLSLASHTAALVCALLALVAGGWLSDAVLRGDLGRWLAVWRTMPDLADRTGVAAGAVAATGLAIAGALAGAAAWAGALGTLGVPASQPVDAAVGFTWLLMPLVGGPGAAGAVAGAAVLVGIEAVARALGVPALVLAGPVAAVLLWRRA
jgi:ABC-type branched-subunit amino acid transport system permease subunit